MIWIYIATANKIDFSISAATLSADDVNCSKHKDQLPRKAIYKLLHTNYGDGGGGSVFGFHAFLFAPLGVERTGFFVLQLCIDFLSFVDI